MQALQSTGALPQPSAPTESTRTGVKKDSLRDERAQVKEEAETRDRRPVDEAEALSVVSLPEEEAARRDEVEVEFVDAGAERPLREALAPPAKEEQLEEAVESLRRQGPSLGAGSLKISYNEDASRYVVQIVDRETGDEIQQIPSEKLLEVSRRLGEMRGLLFDEKS